MSLPDFPVAPTIEGPRFVAVIEAGEGDEEIGEPWVAIPLSSAAATLASLTEAAAWRREVGVWADQFHAQCKGDD